MSALNLAHLQAVKEQRRSQARREEKRGGVVGGEREGGKEVDTATAITTITIQ